MSHCRNMIKLLCYDRYDWISVVKSTVILLVTNYNNAIDFVDKDICKNTGILGKVSRYQQVCWQSILPLRIVILSVSWYYCCLLCEDFFFSPFLMTRKPQAFQLSQKHACRVFIANIPKRSQPMSFVDLALATKERLVASETVQALARETIILCLSTRECSRRCTKN